MITKIKKFSCEWCGPCKVLHNRLIDFNRVPIKEIDCENNPDEVDKYNIRNVPVLIFLDGDTEVVRLTGLVTIDDINNKIDEYEKTNNT